MDKAGNIGDVINSPGIISELRHSYMGIWDNTQVRFEAEANNLTWFSGGVGAFGGKCAYLRGDAKLTATIPSTEESTSGIDKTIFVWETEKGRLFSPVEESSDHFTEGGLRIYWWSQLRRHARDYGLSSERSCKILRESFEPIDETINLLYCEMQLRLNQSGFSDVKAA
jgi:hypothetical protein